MPMVGSLVNGLGVVFGWWHNIIQIHIIMLCGADNIPQNNLIYSLTRFEHGKIFCGIMSVPQNTIMDLNKCFEFEVIWSFVLYLM